MEPLIDKLLLLLFGMLFLLGENQRTLPVLIFLTSLLLAAWITYFENSKLISGMFLCFFILCFIFPMQLSFLPLIIYCILEKKIKWPLAAAAAAAIFALNHLSFTNMIELSLLCAGAVLLEYKTRQKFQMKQELIRQRDSSVELNEALREKNKDLLEKQDYELYLATLRERNRIAREIHDNVGHMISRSLLQTGALLTIEKEGTVHKQLLGIKESLNQAMNSIRESVHDLHDDAIDLEQTVKEAVKDMKEQYEIQLDYDMSQVIPRNVKYCFISTVKEAMSNIIKHSNGDKVRIFMREHPKFYQLSIEDNGNDAKINENGGIGLNNMKERVDALHGTLRIQTEQGFHIFISVQKTEENLCE